MDFVTGLLLSVNWKSDYNVVIRFYGPETTRFIWQLLCYLNHIIYNVFEQVVLSIYYHLSTIIHPLLLSAIYGQKTMQNCADE